VIFFAYAAIGFIKFSLALALSKNVEAEKLPPAAQDTETAPLLGTSAKDKKPKDEVVVTTIYQQREQDNSNQSVRSVCPGFIRVRSGSTLFGDIFFQAQIQPSRWEAGISVLHYQYHCSCFDPGRLLHL